MAGQERNWLAILMAMAACAQTAVALTPESPQVKAAVAKGMAYLSANAQSDQRTGALALAGLAAIKSEGGKDHPLVQQAVKRIRAELESKGGGEFESSEQIYHLGLSLVFLCSADSAAYRSEIDAVMAKLLSKQKPHGGWGYPGNEAGDTSMTQYGVLALWETYHAGANPPLQAWEKVCNWLLRTQDPGGGFGYQGVDPGNYTLVQQDVRPSMSAAGLGSTYVCAEHFGLASDRTAETPKNVPSALKVVKKPVARDTQRPAAVDIARLKAATQRGNGWFGKNFTANPDSWKYYYFYAYERYQSFREVVEGIKDAEPAWFTALASDLIKQQGANGSWSAEGGPVPDTAFAILVLVRGTKKSIEQALGAGTLVGGRGLPTDANNITIRGGNVVRKPLSGPAQQLLSVMEDPNNPDFLAAVEGLAEVKLEADDAQLPAHLVRLRKLAGGDSPQARAAALRLLGRARDLNSVPLLIFALNDPDLGVVKEARDALRFISRKFDSFGPEIPEGTYDLDKFDNDRRKAILAWKTWYLSVRPDHQFDN